MSKTRSCKKQSWNCCCSNNVVHIAMTAEEYREVCPAFNRFGNLSVSSEHDFRRLAIFNTSALTQASTLRQSFISSTSVCGRLTYSFSFLGNLFSIAFAVAVNSVRLKPGRGSQDDTTIHSAASFAKPCRLDTSGFLHGFRGCLIGNPSTARRLLRSLTVVRELPDFTSEWET